MYRQYLSGIKVYSVHDCFTTLLSVYNGVKISDKTWIKRA